MGSSEKKGILLERLADISDNLDNLGIVHLADILTECIEDVSSNAIVGLPLKLKKVSNILDSKGLFDIAEEIDDLLPSILEMKSTKKAKSRSGRMAADQMYKIAKKFDNMYMEGIIDEKSFEYKKMKELKEMLVAGFLSPPPANCKKIPKSFASWWDFFEKRMD